MVLNTSPSIRAEAFTVALWPTNREITLKNFSSCFPRDRSVNFPFHHRAKGSKLITLPSPSISRWIFLRLMKPSELLPSSDTFGIATTLWTKSTSFMPFDSRNTLTNFSANSSCFFASSYRSLLNSVLPFTSMRITPMRRCKTTKSISPLSSFSTKRFLREATKGQSFGKNSLINFLYLNCDNTNIGWFVSRPNLSRHWNICNSAKSPLM